MRARGENERVVAGERAHDLRADELFLPLRREGEVRLSPPPPAEVEREAITRTAVRIVFSLDDAADDEIELL